MYLEEYLKKIETKKIRLFVDMDGVIVDYVVGDAENFANRRALKTSIDKLEKISKMDNVELYILSITRMDKGFSEKNEWLDKNAPFFTVENRAIISRESNGFASSYDLKTNYFKGLERDGSTIIFIDDDPLILKEVGKANDDVVLLKDTALVD